MANIMIRTKLNPGVAPTLSNPAETWGVCQADEVAIFIGNTPTARLKGVTVRNQLRKLARNLAKRPGAPPSVAASGTIEILNLGKRARGVAGFLGVAANDTLTVGATVLTFVAADPGEGDVLLGADDNEAAANVAAIFANVPLLAAQYTVTVIPSNDPGVVAAQLIVEAKVRGDAGNAVALEQTGNHITVSGATLAGGTEGDGLTIDLGEAALEFGAALPLENGITIGDTDDETAANLAAVINAHSALVGLVTATAAPSADPGTDPAIVTVTAVARGTGGNAIGLATDAVAAVAVSGAALAGGAAKVKRNIKSPTDLKDTISAEAVGAGVAPAGLAILVGDTAFDGIDRTGRFLRAVEECLQYFARTISRVS